MDQRISLITLGVADLSRARAFYAALGWREAPASQAGIAFFQLPGQGLGLFPLDALAADQGRARTALGTGAVTLAHNLESREAVDRSFAAALAAGATALRAPEPAVWGGYSGYWSDPDGHVWEIAHNPIWPLGPDGALSLPATP